MNVNKISISGQQTNLNPIKLDNLPTNIKDLQSILKSLLNNIQITGKTSTTKPFNIADTTDNNIYKINETDDLDIENYMNFLKFMIKELTKNNTDFENDKGDIITAHWINDEHKKDIEEIKERYKEIYLSKYIPPSKKYPYWVEDLLAKNRNVLYEESEKKLNIKNILEQDDNEFIETLKKRINGLKSCSIDPEEQKKKNEIRQEYFNEEYKLENSILPDSYTIDGKTPEEVKDKIKELCNNIYWGTKTYEYKKNKKFNFEEFYNFITTHINELEFIKTFLPSSCFNKQELKTKDELKPIIDSLVHSNDRTHRQYIFGIKDDVKEFITHKQFYEIYSMNDGSSYNLHEKSYNCHLLANWTIFLNMLYSKCATYNNDSINDDTDTNIKFPIRFILPDTYQNLLISKNLNNIESNAQVSDYENNIDKKHYKINKNKFIFEDNQDIRSIKIFSNIFNKDNKLKLKFVGFINIKYNYKQTNQYRNWILLIFKNEENKNFSLVDYITGELSSYILLNYKFEHVNTGSLTKKISITYEEFKNFILYSEKQKIYLYIYKDNKTLFIKNTLLTKKQMEINNIKLFNLELIEGSKSKQLFIPTQFSYKGGYNNIVNKINIKTSTYINLFDDKLSNGIFNQYYNLRLSYDIIYLIKREGLIKIINSLYKYLLVSTNEIILSNKYEQNYFNKYLITKYHPLYYKYYFINEIFIKFNILNNIKKNDTILSIGNNLTPIEILKYNNYKIKNIKCIIYEVKDSYLKEQTKEQKKYSEIVKNIYDIDFIYFTDKIEKLLDIDLENINNYTLFIYNIYNSPRKFFMYNDFHNILNLFIGMMMSLKYTKKNGNCIINLGSIAYKQTADIYLILKEYFKESNLYYPEISNLFKDNGITAIFKKFKGINKYDYDNLMVILLKLLKIYPNDLLTSFNIYNKEDREKFKIIKPIDENKKINYVTGFLPDNTDYSEIIDFNNSIYPEKLLFLQKVINRYNNPMDIKIPTQDQILSSILYCRKYNIPIFDKYTITKQNKTITNTILNELYGLHEPIILKFKTPYQTTIANKIMVNPKFKHIKSIKKSSTKTKNKHKTIKNTLNNSFFNSLFENNNKALKHKSSKHKALKHKSSKHKASKHKSSKHQSTYKAKKTSKKLKHTMMSLEDAIHESNNSIEQVGRLMDVRKDFTKSNPNELYDTLKEKLRFYKGPGKIKHIRNVEELHLTLSKRLNNFNISQAWIKMYEIIMDCDLVPTNRKGIFKSFHICEAPGTFISCINHYIHTKTQYNSYEWKSQSLKPKGAKSKYDTVGDTYGFIKKYPNHWDFGIDDTGDITNIENIKYYAKMAKQMNINLMTSDCGLPMGDNKYLQVAYASYVSLLYSLPKNGTLLYKILSPIDTPLLWNLIYMTYRNFKEMYFFKPVQNSQSREFYIIGKGYLGTEQSTLDKLLNLVDKFDNPNFNKEEYDLYNDTYPEEFVIQVQTICEKLSSNYVNSIERIIYYIDNIDELGKDYQKHIESYIAEKNEDWLRKYKPLRLDKKFSL